MNKTADRNGKSLGRIFKPKIPYVESEHFIYILPDSLPTHTGLRKKYMAVCWTRILIGIPTGLKEAWTQGQMLICSKKFLFKSKGKVIEN